MSGPFVLAGILDAWKESKKPPQQVDTWLQSYTILTTVANDLVAGVDTRMPVIVHQRDYDLWLNPFSSERQLIELLRPYGAAEMKVNPRSHRILSGKNSDSEMLLATTGTAE